MAGAKFAKVAELYLRWEYEAKQKKKIAVLFVLKVKEAPSGNVLAKGMVSTRRAVTDVSELVDGARVWHYQRGE